MQAFESGPKQIWRNCLCWFLDNVFFWFYSSKSRRWYLQARFGPQNYVNIVGNLVIGFSHVRFGPLNLVYDFRRRDLALKILPVFFCRHDLVPKILLLIFAGEIWPSKSRQHEEFTLWVFMGEIWPTKFRLWFSQARFGPQNLVNRSNLAPFFRPNLACENLMKTKTKKN